MKTRVMGLMLILACAIAGAACVTVPYQPVYRQPPPPQPAPVPVAEAEPEAAPSGAEDQPFYDELAPDGQWVYVSGPGWVWTPYDVPTGWRPYQIGHWVYTDYGWTWASDESFGWAVYHYGRWTNDPAYGWVWVPGTEWGPAWVAWHEGGGWIGWAPLPWQVQWRAGFGLDWGGVSVNVALGPSAWYFVPSHAMVDPNLRYRAAPPARNVTLIQITQNVTNYTVINNHVVDHSVNVEHIGRAVGHPIPQYRVRSSDSQGAAQGGRVRGEEFVVFRPNPGRRVGQDRPVPPGRDETRRPDRDHSESGDPRQGQRNSQPESTNPNPERSTPPGRPESRWKSFPGRNDPRRDRSPHSGSAAGNSNPEAPAPDTESGRSTSDHGRGGPGNSTSSGVRPPAPESREPQNGRPPGAAPESGGGAPDHPGQINKQSGEPNHSGSTPAAPGKTPPGKGNRKKPDSTKPKAGANKKDEPDKKDSDPDKPKSE